MLNSFLGNFQKVSWLAYLPKEQALLPFFNVPATSFYLSLQVLQMYLQKKFSRVAHSVQKVQPPLHRHPLLIFSEPLAFGKTFFQQYCPNEIPDKHKT